MILVLGGTTEGRRAVDVLDKAGKPFFYSTKSSLQTVDSSNAVRVIGGLDQESMAEFCRHHGIKMLVDAAHPFAAQLHSTVEACSRQLSIPVIRYERVYPEPDLRVIWCDDFDDAVAKMRSDNVKRLLALTGVQTIAKLRGFWADHDCYFRILNREESMDIADKAGFVRDRLLFYENDVDILPLIGQIHPDAIVTKESGESGGFSKKVTEAISASVRVYAVARPKLPEDFIVVTGDYGLRKAVERLCPGFFELRSGFTTGACATAAAKAALLALVGEQEPEYVSFRIPDGEEMWMKIDCYKILDNNTAEAAVVKDAGDDPDVTNGCKVGARVSLANHGEVHFIGGEGVGTVTLPGTGLDIGQPAINPVPRQMMTEELLAIYPEGCDVTISVPGGAELAKRTFNGRIGIEGGISIIGTTGIVMPFSHEAFMEAICREMEVAKALGCERVVLNSGAKSEKAVKSRYHHLPAAAFIHYGNAIGESLEMADALHIESLAVGVMIGKAVKLAEGNTDTHSHKVTINREFLARVAASAGCSPEAQALMSRINMARELWQGLSSDDAKKFFPKLLSLCKDVCRKCYKNGALTMHLIDDVGNIVTSN